VTDFDDIFLSAFPKTDRQAQAERSMGARQAAKCRNNTK